VGLIRLFSGISVSLSAVRRV